MTNKIRIIKGKPEKNGYWYGDQYISSVYPVVLAKRRYCTKSQQLIKYDIALYDADEDRFYGDAKTISDLRKINYYELFGYPDALFSSDLKKLFLVKIQIDAEALAEEVVYYNYSGILTTSDGTTHFVLGNEIFSKTKCDYQPKVSGIYTIRKNHSGNMEAHRPSYVRKTYPLYLEFWPGVSEILTMYALSSVTRAFMENTGKCFPFVLYLRGEHGHLKTTMAKLYCLNTETAISQKVDFSMSKKEIKQAILKYEGTTVLLDDYHPVHTRYRKQSQESLLDEMVRFIASGEMNTNLVVTGENNLDFSVLSCMDRMFLVSVPKIEAQDLAKKKTGIDALIKSHGDFMAEAIRLLAIKLMENYEQVINDIEDFLREKHSSFAGDMRIGSHIEILMLTEMLFRKYCLCNPGENEWTKRISDAINWNAEMQVKEMTRLYNKQYRDYVADLRDLVNTDNFSIVLYSDTDIETYNLKLNQVYNGKILPIAIYKESKIYIKREVLQMAYTNKYGFSVDIKTLLKQAEAAGVLLVGGDEPYKKIFNMRHMVFLYPLLEKYRSEQ